MAPSLSSLVSISEACKDSVPIFPTLRNQVALSVTLLQGTGPIIFSLQKQQALYLYIGLCPLFFHTPFAQSTNFFTPISSSSISGLSLSPTFVSLVVIYWNFISFSSKIEPFIVEWRV
jgi:hypothetical protein